jgi:hypothetical protein
MSLRSGGLQSFITLTAVIWTSTSTHGQRSSPGAIDSNLSVTQKGKATVPTLDDLGTNWLVVDEMAHMPSLHNFHDMAACAPDLIGVNYNPDGQLFDWPTGPRWFRYISLPLLRLRVNGHELQTTEFRWYPYQAVRRAEHDGLKIQTTVRMAFEGPGLLYKIHITNTSSTAKQVDVELAIPGKQLPVKNGTVIAYQSKDPKLEKSHGFGDKVPQNYAAKQGQLEVAHAFVDKPSQIAGNDQVVTAHWSWQLAGGESKSLRFVMAHGRNSGDFPAPSLLSTTLDWAEHFKRSWNDVKAQWAKRWQDVFTPCNNHFSGNLPTLVTDDEKLRDIYYRSLLTLLVLHRTNMKLCDRVFVTSGERDKGVVFFWDTSMWSKVFALLDPKAMKQHAKIFLSCDPHRGPVYNMATGEQWDGWYAANDSTIFTFVDEYINSTGDIAFLDETVGDRTVLQHLETLATNWQKLQSDKRVMLADYGENRNLLECAPAYVHRVPSFNAANVWMMRIVANLQAQRGNTARAAQLRDWANQISQAVLKLYKPGDGVWYALHRDGKRVELRHCYDFVCIGKFMHSDLTPQMQREMVAFVEQELLDGHWMRAMSLLDEAAAKSDRPDHGPMGAYDAWPALTAESLCLLGEWKPAVEFLRNTQTALNEGVYGQAHEYYGEHRGQRGAPVRIAMRGACMRESVGGGAFAEMMIGTLLGFQPQANEPLKLYRADVARGFEGSLVNVRYNGRLLDITSNAEGVSYRYQE